MKHLFTIVLGLFASYSLQAQHATVDLSFNPYPGLVGANLNQGSAQDIAIQADGKILITGAFLRYDSDTCRNIVRVNPDGSRDPSFQVGTGLTGLGQVWGDAVTVQPDGKILVGGAFSSYNDTTYRNIVRLLPDGSPDPEFIVGSGFDRTVLDIKVLPDGRILCVGAFSQYKGVDRSKVAILLPDGTLDPDFVPPVFGIQNAVWRTAVQADGKILLGGTMDSMDGEPIGRLVRLNTDGSVDADFPQGTGFDALVLALHVMDDGRILVGGGFTEYDGNPRPRLVRLMPDGALDPTFSSLVSVNEQVRAIVVDGQGRIIICGNFTQVNDQVRRYLAWLLPDGTLDPDHEQSVRPNLVLLDALIQPDGKLVIGGGFDAVGSYWRYGIARLHPGYLNAVQEPDEAGFTLHPNPSHGLFHVQVPVPGEMLLSVIDPSGRTVHTERIVATGTSTHALELSHLGSGIYILRLDHPTGPYTTRLVRH